MLRPPAATIWPSGDFRFGQSWLATPRVTSMTGAAAACSAALIQRPSTSFQSVISGQAG